MKMFFCINNRINILENRLYLVTVFHKTIPLQKFVSVYEVNWKSNLVAAHNMTPFVCVTDLIRAETHYQISYKK